MKHVQTGAVVVAGIIVLVIAAASLLRPILPWLLALFFLATILKLAIRD